jgi:hypothetical protein
MKRDEIMIRFNLIGSWSSRPPKQGHARHGRVPFEDARPRLYPPDEACCFVSAGAGTAMVRFLK